MAETTEMANFCSIEVDIIFEKEGRTLRTGIEISVPGQEDKWWIITHARKLKLNAGKSDAGKLSEWSLVETWVKDLPEHLEKFHRLITTEIPRAEVDALIAHCKEATSEIDDPPCENIPIYCGLLFYVAYEELVKDGKLTFPVGNKEAMEKIEMTRKWVANDVAKSSSSVTT
ncbi:hypothetical protein AJ80_04117 [Polytolypa hystricis UAMH7299]|uniref:Uncharacterized protein n=1 Tax=Polytolypa hystricis (strain UAMH7299) TaxID=1447883 RepID=A0A2B7YEE5_POLH7|nr:hypothetical protein AJ80_04117 [Polytolypa hystricis UAMH7299]